MTIHDVDMDDVGIGLYQLDLVGQMREVRREDRCRQFPHGADCNRGQDGRSAGLLERRHEHPVGAVAMRPEAMSDRRIGASGPGVSMGCRSGRWRIIASDAASVSALGNVHTEKTMRPAGRSRSAAAIAISTWSRARRESSSRRGAPEQLRPPARGADPRTRRVHEHPVEGTTDGGSDGVLDEDEGVEPEPPEARRDQAVRSGWRSGGGDPALLADPACDEGRLPPRCRAGVEHAVARLRGERVHDERRRLVLHGEPTLIPSGERRGVPAGKQDALRMDASRSRARAPRLRRASITWSTVARQVFTRRASGPCSPKASAARSTSSEGRGASPAPSPPTGPSRSGG